FTEVLKDNLKGMPQYVDRAIKGKLTAPKTLDGPRFELENKEHVCAVSERDVTQLSGRELQR
ncbi:hypothetical protein B0H15DRAFT_787702, partial [Mycena belliarum]